MTLLERKAELARAILNDMDEETLNELEAIYLLRTSGKTPPCQYSKEELNQRATQAIESMEAGRVTSHDVVRNRFRAV
ncbi:MAG: hypothetical protein LUD02_08555 [Tannerellaceae bacterium]|nr:hypothetical protein [Tannerellaceae bacterium]MCD8264190.1 hypothetical protein [Tannerellaceae bacterium]